MTSKGQAQDKPSGGAAHVSKEVRIINRGDRGFHGYGEPFNDSYGGEIEVYESSSAEGPHVWVRFRPGPGFTERPDVSMHLSEYEAEDLIARLQTWLDEIPARWGKER